MMRKIQLCLIAMMTVLTASAQNEKTMETKDTHPFVVNLYYTGKDGNARKFVEEMERSGTAKAIRAEKGNLRYDYFFPATDPETVLLIDSWDSQAALDAHHASPMMKTIAGLRDKYQLTMRVERDAQENARQQDRLFIRTGNQSSEEKKVTGIGGIMFKSKDPKATRKWYDENLGIKDDPNGHLFEWIDKDDHSTTGVTVWSPMSAATEYLDKPEQQFMINYRVENLEMLAKELQSKGVTLLDTIQNYDGLGKCLHILDIDGSRVELWEPVR